MCWVKLLLLLLVTLWAGSPVLAAGVKGSQAPLIFVVHSYNPEYVWSQNISKGVQDALKSLKPHIETFYLDAKRDQDPDSLRQKALAVLERIEAVKPQVVIAVDDAAQIHLVTPHLKGRASPQVIFCAVNAQLKNYGFPAKNVSGVRERWHFRQSFALLKEIKPAIRRVTLLTDNSESSSYILADLKDDRRQGGVFALKQIHVEQVATYQQWQRAVRASQSRDDALAMGIYLSLRDEDTDTVVPRETVNAWTIKANKLPTLGFADYVLEDGQLCGVLESGHEQGLLAGAMARQVLERGLKAGGLPVRINQKGVVVVNLKTAERLEIILPFAIIEAAGVVIK